MSKEFTTIIKSLLDIGGESLRSVFNEHQELLKKAEEITINFDSHESYEDAVELKRVLKKTHISIENQRKEFRAEIMKMARDLDNYSDDLYQPFREAELKVKEQCDEYESQKKTVRKLKGKAKKEEQKQREEIEKKLYTLNTQLSRINGARDLGELEHIENVLNFTKLEEFGDKKDEAGFILSNLRVVLKNKRELIGSQEGEDSDQETPFKDDKDIVYENIKLPLDDLKKDSVETKEEAERNKQDEEQFEALIDRKEKNDTKNTEQENTGFNNVFEDGSINFNLPKKENNE